MKCSDLRSSYPSFFMSKNKIQLNDEIDINKILSEIANKYSHEKVNTLDGVKIDFADKWVHLRTSNTEPIIRIYSESYSKSDADLLANRFIDEINALLKH